MKWNIQEIKQFEQSKEFVDTVIIPLLPISFSENMKQMIEITEFVNLLTHQIEKQLKGRIMLLPGFTYLKTIDIGNYINLLNKKENNLFNSFNHIFYVTADNDWIEIADKLEGNLIWLPSISLNGISEQKKHLIVKEQVTKLLQLFIEKWREIE